MSKLHISMIQLKRSIVLLSLCIGLATTWAQVQQPVTWSHEVQGDQAVVVGDEVVLAFTAEIEEGHWVYSSVPAEGNPGAATSFEVDATQAIELSGELNEAGKPTKYYDDIFQTDMVKFYDRVIFKQPVKITGEDAKLEGYIRYQVCNDQVCIPGDYTFSFDPEVSEKKKTTIDKPANASDQVDPQQGKSQQEGQDRVKTPAAVDPDELANSQEIASAESPGTDELEALPQFISPDNALSSQDSVEEEITLPSVDSPTTQRGGSLLTLIIQGFLFGLASVLTPCIFPMIPLTVSYFTKREQQQHKGTRDAIFYGGSIIAIYTGLALALSAIFGPETMQQIAISPWFNLAFFVLLVVFGLSFMGMFDITLPSSWSTAVGKQSSRGGLGGIFLMALALAIVSFSCTGPIVATALGSAFYQGEFIAPVVTMLAFSTAMALPFVLFAIFPQWLTSLPKSGGWLNSVKVTLGLLELALAFIYLSRADLVMNWDLLSREAFIGVWIVIFSVLGFYLLGKIQLPHDSPVERLPIPRLLLAMSSLWFVLYLIPGLWGAPLKMLGGYMPPSTEDIGVLLQAGQVGGAATGSAPQNDICTYPDKRFAHLEESTPRGFCAFYDLEEGLAYAEAHNKPVFLDFTGHTCANCRYLEQNAWTDPEVKRYINEEYVLISLYTDDRVRLSETEILPSGKKLRTVGDKWLQYEIEQYNSNAQPLYVLLDHDKTPLVAPIGYNPPLRVETYRSFFENGLMVFHRRRES